MLWAPRYRELGRWLAVVLWAVVWAAPVLAAQPQVTGIELRQQGDITRIAIDLSQRADYRVFFLNEPMRAIIDLPPVSWTVSGNLPAPRGLVAGYRYGLFDPTTARLVVDLAGPARVHLVRYDLPARGVGYRLVVELEKTTQSAFDDQVQPWTHSVTKAAKIVTAPQTAAVVPPAPPVPTATAAHAPEISMPRAPTPRPAAPPPAVEPGTKLAAAVTPAPSGAPMPTPVITPPRAPRKGDAKHIVAIDAGHGGVDPGAIGISGIYEKDVTLAMVREVKRQLEITGRYKVALTRDEDIFVPLRERIARARNAGAELFVSIHADSMRNKETRGASIYTLSENASDDEAAALAAHENRSDIIAGVDLSHENKEVTSILIDLAQRETMNHSLLLANYLVEQIGREIQLIPLKPHRFAGFAVLKAPDVPSALVELGYLSNKADEAQLTRPHQRTKVAGSIARAIDQYFQHRPARS